MLANPPTETIRTIDSSTFIIPGPVMRHRGISWQAKATYAALMFIDSIRGLCPTPSSEESAELVGLTDDEFLDGMDELEDAGLLSITYDKGTTDCSFKLLDHEIFTDAILPPQDNTTE